MGNKLRLVINQKNKLIIVSVFLFLGVLLIYLATSAGNTAFNHFTLLANSFLKGKLYIEGDYSWLERIPIEGNKFYVANPPGPAILSIPFVYLFGENFPQQYIAQIFGSFLAVATFFLAYSIKKDKKLAIWSSLLVSLGSLNWYLCAIGSTWYMAQVVSQFFLTLALLTSFKYKKPFFTGIFLGFSYLCRIPTILSLPLFLYLYKKNWLKNFIKLGAGIVPFILFNALYNFARFGVIWDIGYTLLFGLSSEPWYQDGVVNIKYIPRHLKIIFAAIPKTIDFWKESPSVFGYAIWFTTPAFIFSIFARGKNKKDKAIPFSWLSILLIAFLIFSHGSTGFSQFGYRFAADFYPILTFLTIKAVSQEKKIKTYHWFLLLIGIIVNFWGISYL